MFTNDFFCEVSDVMESLAIKDQKHMFQMPQYILLTFHGVYKYDIMI